MSVTKLFNYDHHLLSTTTTEDSIASEIFTDESLKQIPMTEKMLKCLGSKSTRTQPTTRHSIDQVVDTLGVEYSYALNKQNAALWILNHTDNKGYSKKDVNTLKKDLRNEQSEDIDLAYIPKMNR